VHRQHRYAARVVAPEDVVVPHTLIFTARSPHGFGRAVHA